MLLADEQAIGTVDTQDLRELNWPLVRLFFPRFVEEIELGRYVKRLLATRRWRAIHMVPHRDAAGHASEHIFDVFGVPTDGTR